MLRLCALLALALAGVVLPVFRVMRPQGVFAVGTLAAPGMQVWYPAAAGSGRVAGYGAGRGGVAQRLMHFAGTDGHVNAPFAGGVFPVVLYVHGWGGSRWENTGLLQDIASRGYVVVAADQPGGVVDGVAIGTPMDTSSPAAWDATQRVAGVKLTAQVAAARGVLDRLTGMEALAGRVDMGRVAVVGFSFGGATAAELAVTDGRIRAAVNMDGLLFGRARGEGVAVPYLELSDDEPVDGPQPGADVARRTLEEIQQADDRVMRMAMARHGGTLVIFADTLHGNFTDEPVLVPWRRFTGAGAADPQRTARIVADWVGGFLDHVFAGGAQPDAGRYGAAVRVERWEAGGTR